MSETRKLPQGFTGWEGPVFRDGYFPPNVGPRTHVEVIFRNGYRYVGQAEAFGWYHNNFNTHVHIIGYRVISNDC